MVNHICEPISSNQFASCSSARVGQGGGGAPLTVDMRGAENDEPEMSFRRGYQQGAIEVFCAIERFLDPGSVSDA